MSNHKKQTGIHQLYAADPVAADKQLWGREPDPLSRRGFLTRGSLAAMAAVLGADIVFADRMPSGLIPAALAGSDDPFSIKGKHPGLVVLNDRPWNVETPAHLLDDAVTPADRFFIRNNGIPPQNIEPKNWTLTIDGESAAKATSFSLQDLKTNFKQYTYQLVLECGGNGRHEFFPPAKGNQWTTGAVGCAQWTGVRLKDVLESAGIKPDAVYIGYYGKDVHPSGDSKKVVISRGVPMAKALENESLIAWAMNGDALPLMHGYPLRLVFGGWPASTSGKWLYKISIRNKVHDGEKMEGSSYRVPCNPVAPGSEVPDGNMCIIESMPVKSLITGPRTGAVISDGRVLDVRGHAWAGDHEVASVHVSIDFGSTWKKCELSPPANRLAWQRWRTRLSFPKKGYFEVWARATDTNGVSQPMMVPAWNPKGYLNNACHRIAVKVV